MRWCVCVCVRCSAAAAACRAQKLNYEGKDEELRTSSLDEKVREGVRENNIDFLDDSRRRHHG